MAITFGHSSAATVGASPRTVAHDCTGDNYILIAGYVPGTADTVTAVSYNGVAATFIKSVLSDAGANDYTISVWGLASPTTGSNNISITTSSGTVGIGGLSYAGANGGLDNSASNSQLGASPLTVTLTTVADNCWTVLFASDGGSNPAAGTGTTQRVSGTPGGGGSFDSNGAITPAGSTSLQITYTGIIADGVMVSLSPTSAAATATASTLMMMGV